MIVPSASYETDASKTTEFGEPLSPARTSKLAIGGTLARAEQAAVKVGLATDIGAGTSFSLLKTMAEAYKIQQLRNHALTPFKSYYLATLGGARTLGLHDSIGNFEVGKEADFVVLDYRATPLLDLRIQGCRTLAARLFALAMLGDDRVVKTTYLLGEAAHCRE